MKNIFSPFTKLVAFAACALTLGSCSRSEYTMLPQGSSYHGVARVSTPVPVAATPAAATAEIVPAATAPEVAVAPAPVPTTPAVKATRAAAGTSATLAAAPAPKVNALQRLALNKVTRKVDKLLQNSPTARQHDNTASTTKGGISGNLRIGLILLLVGLLVGLLNGLIGTIIAIVGLIFIVLWLLDQL